MSCGLCFLNTGQPPGITITLIYKTPYMWCSHLRQNNCWRRVSRDLAWVCSSCYRVNMRYNLDILLVYCWSDTGVKSKLLGVKPEELYMSTLGRGLVAMRLQISTDKNKKTRHSRSEIWAQYQRRHSQQDVHTTSLFLMICPWLLSSSVQPPQIIPTHWLALVLACQLSWTDSRSQWNSRIVEWIIDFSQLHKGHA